MKIYSGKREDILRERHDYISRRDEYMKNKKDKERLYDLDEFDFNDNFISNLKQVLPNTPLLELDLRLHPTFHGGIEVRIQCNEDNKFSDNSALSWDFSVELTNDGEVVKETGSWSGLKATTEEQLESLQQTLELLKVLNKLDWKTILGDAQDKRPKYSDEKYRYEYDEEYENNRTRDFDRQLTDLDIEESIGKDILIPVNNKGRYYRGPIYFGIVAATPKSYTVYEVPEFGVNDSDSYKADVYRISKEKLIIDDSRSWITK